MITRLRHLLRLVPFLFGGRRQLALENLTLRRQLAVHKRTTSRRGAALDELVRVGRASRRPKAGGWVLDRIVKDSSQENVTPRPAW
jgi:hypothetical protein